MVAHERRTLPGQVARTRDEFTWTQSASGNWYVGTVVSKLMESGSNTVLQKTTTQTLDGYGNVTDTVQKDWGDVNPRTYHNDYLATSNYVRNRLTSTKVTPAGGTQFTLVTNTYDVYTGYPCGLAAALTDLPGSALGTRFELRDELYGARESLVSRRCQRTVVRGI